METNGIRSAQGGYHSRHGCGSRRPWDPAGSMDAESGELTYRPAAPAVDWLDFNACVRALAAGLDGGGLSLEEHYGDLPCLYLLEDELERVAAAVLERARAGRREGRIRIETRSEGGQVALLVSCHGAEAGGASSGSARDASTALRVLFPLESMEGAGLAAVT